jgi:hypothetical protein
MLETNYGLIVDKMRIAEGIDGTESVEITAY